VVHLYVVIIRIPASSNPPSLFLCQCCAKEPCVDSLAAYSLLLCAVDIVVVGHLHKLLNGAMHEEEVTLEEMVCMENLLLGEPRDGIAANAVEAGHVDVVGTLPLLTVKKINTQHLSVFVHNRDSSCEPTSLLFCEV